MGLDFSDLKIFGLKALIEPLQIYNDKVSGFESPQIELIAVYSYKVSLRDQGVRNEERAFLSKFYWTSSTNGEPYRTAKGSCR